MTKLGLNNSDIEQAQIIFGHFVTHSMSVSLSGINIDTAAKLQAGVTYLYGPSLKNRRIRPKQIVLKLIAIFIHNELLVTLN